MSAASIQIIRSFRLYFWPIIAANVFAVGFSIRASLSAELTLSLLISLLASFGFMLNDLTDLRIDRINKPGHLEESSKSILHLTAGLAAACCSTGIILAGRLGAQGLKFAGALAVGLLAYSLIFRRIILVPNLLAAALETSPLWGPLYVWPGPASSLRLFFIFSLALFLVSREIIMDVRDKVGDLAGARLTLPIMFGGEQAIKWAIAISAAGGAIAVLVVAARIQHLPVPSQIACVLICPFVGYVLSRSFLQLSHAGSIQRYVLWSRIAMAVVPILIVFLWR